MRSTLTVALAGLTLTALVAAACSLGTGGTSTSQPGQDASTADALERDAVAPADVVELRDGGEPLDAAPDAPEMTDACLPTSLLCNGQCVSSCAGCAAGEAACPTTRVCGDCSTCLGFQLECFSCDDAGVATAFCGQTGGALCGLAPHCSCAGGDAGACPGQNQICTGGPMAECRSCGEAMTDKKVCASGKACDEKGMPPACSM